MKNEWSYSPCQYGSSSGLSDAAAAGAVSPPAAHSYNSMGHQPAGQHFYHHHHHHYPPRGDAAAVRGSDAHPIDLRCSCTCAHMPQHRTILHGILTGRGYKFGYGTAFEPHFFPPHNFDQEDFFMGLQAIEPKDHSPEVTSLSRYTSPPADK